MSGIGPLEIVVIAFPGTALSDHAADALRMVEVTGDVRIVDALVVTKSQDGAVRTDRPGAVAALAEVAAEYGLTGLPLAPIQPTDVAAIAACLTTPGIGLAVLVEHVWARDAAEAAGVSDHAPVALLRIPKG